jgi:phosphate uptake regulator
MLVSRKVQQTATGSFLITLPMDWVQDCNLKKGDVVEISLLDDGSIKIKPVEG